VVFEAGGALVAVGLEAGGRLSTDADAVAEGNVFDVVADTDGGADDFVAYAAGVERWTLGGVS
jgi:hypothetical protein